LNTWVKFGSAGPSRVGQISVGANTLAELARHFATSPKAMLHRLDAVPVTGPAIDGCRQYFYRRMDLESALVPAAAYSEAT
jgi:hypothetical protein